MKLFSFLSSWFSKKEELALSFSIDSGKVIGSILGLSRICQPKILYEVSFSIPIKDKKPDNIDKYTDDMLKVFERVVFDIYKNGLAHLKFTTFGSRRIKEVYYTFSSPWCVSQTRIFSLVKPEPVLVTEKLINDFMNEQKKILESKTEQDLIDQTQSTSANPNLQQTKIIEDKVIRVKLNGYFVDQPIGKKAQTIEVVSFMTLVPQVVFKSIEEMVAKHFVELKPHTHSFALAFFSVVRDFFPKEHDSLCIKVDDEITDIAVIRHGAVVEHISIPIGNNYVVRTLADKFATTTETARSVINIHKSNDFEKNTGQKVSITTEKAISLWYTTLKDVCVTLAQELQAPKTVFILVKNPEEDHFYNKMKKEKSLYTQNVDEKLSICPIDVNTLSKQCQIAKMYNNDTELYVNALFSNKIFQA
jgi:hypothetical protein